MPIIPHTRLPKASGREIVDSDAPSGAASPIFPGPCIARAGGTFAEVITPTRLSPALL